MVANFQQNAESLCMAYCLQINAAVYLLFACTMGNLERSLEASDLMLLMCLITVFRCKQCLVLLVSLVLMKSSA